MNGDNNMQDSELIKIIEGNKNDSIRILAIHIMMLKEETKSIKETVNSIKTMVQIGLTVIGILLSIIAIIGYIKLS